MAITSITNATVYASVSGAFSREYPGHTTSTSFAGTFDQDFSDGTGASQANQVIAYSGELDKSGTVDLDLGAAANVYGETVALTAIKGIVVRNTTDITGVTIQVGAAASNPISSLFGDTSDKAVVQNNGVVLWGTTDATGYTVTEDSADVLRLTNTSSTDRATYEVVILGEITADVSSSSSDYSSASSESSSSSST